MLAIPNSLGGVRRVDGCLNAVEDDNRTDRDDGRRNASGDEDTHGVLGFLAGRRNVVIGVLYTACIARPELCKSVGSWAIYDYFEAERVLEARGRGSAATFRREAPKVGRNELCPCGSGKKFPSKTHSIFIDPYDLTMKTACASSENHLNLRIKTYLNGALTSTMAVKQRVSLGHEKL